MTGPRTVLIVDQGTSFGGSALVASTILREMPRSRYRVLLVAAVGTEFLRVPPQLSGQVFHCDKPYTYLNQVTWRERYRTAPQPIRRLRGWGDLLVRLSRNAGYLRALVRLIRRERVDLVHLNNGFENLEAHLAAAITRRPVVVHAHGGAGDSRLIRRIAPRVPMTIAISHGVANTLSAVGVPDERIATLLNPLTVSPAPVTTHERREVRRRFGLPDGVTTAAIVGRVVRWKGQLEFVRAFARARAGLPWAHALIIGEVADDNEAYHREVAEEVARLGLEDRVHFTGFIQDPRELYALADIVVHASIEPEPFGLVLTEAMAYGIPVLAADSGGPLEIITDGQDGLLRSPHDAEALAQALRQLLLDPGRRFELGAAGHARAVSRFNVSDYVGRLADVYDAVLRRPRVASMAR